MNRFGLRSLPKDIVSNRGANTCLKTQQNFSFMGSLRVNLLGKETFVIFVSSFWHHANNLIERLFRQSLDDTHFVLIYQFVCGILY